MIGDYPYIRMENSQFPKTPKKRAPVKRQASICVDTRTSQESTEDPQERLLRLEQRWDEQIKSLQIEVQCLREAMDHLLTEDGMESTHSEDEQN